MISYRVQHAAGRRIDDIYNYTREQWGQDQADRYIRGLFVRFEDIAERRIAWRDIPRGLGVEGFYCRYEHHYVYWRILSDGAVGIVTILHERMHQIERFREDVPN
ncbi:MULTISPECIES: type II toxin-antitoxin system RelE/ParE family toxin [unclassified Sphingobium]|jgi:toxin ParE1/3/4|uniref:type II toxin-antitoxin system RelE/ParE family toxin n=1 Tax=Sphingobium TaxID=165695 RepID=UPI00065C8C3A|nr:MULTISPECIES: type II toxin-antitoxin system RelE/ParE family toxin [unclassified Sphingobium]PNP97690.1 plasmid stabilization protein [Sphingobium sp. SA916]UXC93403.1 type II toxin-antitoxin system RelE/ParE family toxin [Sphingobium sp. RSMS]